MIRKSIVVILLMVLMTAASYVFLNKEVHRPFPETAARRIIEIPHGFGAREVAAMLEERGVVRNRYVALAYLLQNGSLGKLKAGEYLFDRPMTIQEVMNKLTSGDVYLHKFTIPEGLRTTEIAKKWEEQGFGTAEEFELAAEGSVALVRSFDENATSVEGYLFPETYSFPLHTTARQAVGAMIARFQAVISRLRTNKPDSQWPLGLRDTVILASLVETETGRGDERPLVASVYLNRLAQKILLQCDPTVIYALEQANSYKGFLTLSDLKFPSPYNTYVSPGLPPGPIANPGYASLEASVKPATTKYLYFVRASDGGHTFSESLSAHNRAVAAYRKAQQAARRGARSRS